jgi:hypothetical protein
LALSALWLAAVPAGCASDRAPVEVQEGDPGGSGDEFVLGDDEIQDLEGGEDGSRDLTDPSQRCLGETRQAEAIGLDIFVMLDTSGSMLDPLPNAGAGVATKWDAVRQSLQSFVEDEGTADIGMGLQYFPQIRPDVPETCTSSDQCGASGGPCSNSLCVVDIGVVVPAGLGPQYCFDNGDCGGAETCRTLLGECVAPPGARPEFPEGTFLEIERDPGVFVPPLCSVQADCQGIGGTRCELTGRCQNDLLVPCSESLACPANLGPCLDLPDGCVNQTLCESADYAGPAVPISSDTGRTFDIILSLQTRQPSGLTPTGPALSGALEHARQWSLDHPGRQVVTVLATDGFPTECAPQDIADIAQIAEDGNAGEQPVRTFVIGVFGQQDLGLDGQARLDALASAGGTERAIVINTQGGNVADQFLAALNLIRDTAVSCEFQLAADRALDFDQVNLSVTRPDGSRTDLYNVGDASACGADDQGWYYVLDSAGVPSQINACPRACDTFMQGGIRAELQIGCETRIR